MRPRQIRARYHNEDAPTTSGGTIFTVMEENLYNIASVPVVANGTYGFGQVFDVSINDTNKIYHDTTFRFSFTATANGGILAAFPAGLGLPFVIGTNAGTVYEGYSNGGNSGGGAKSCDLTLNAAGDIALQRFTIAVHECLAGQTYTCVFKMSFLN